MGVHWLGWSAVSFHENQIKMPVIYTSTTRWEQQMALECKFWLVLLCLIFPANTLTLQLHSKTAYSIKASRLFSIS
jgi:hypothetical protein